MTLREQTQRREEEQLSPFACLSSRTRGRAREEEECPVRTPFQRDVDRIVYSKAFRRLKHKTQVFLQPEGDHYRTRMTHTLEVTRIARTIARALRLNEDLTEAIALGHDLGHTPFGHAGERCLNKVYHARTGRYFNHNIHSARVLEALYGRNLTLQVLDGVICHNGEYEQRVFELSGLSTFEEFDAGMRACVEGGHDAIKRLRPATLEGCVVRVSDIIAYVGRDRQDAIEADLVDGSEFEDGLGGAYNAWILSHAAVDIIEHSYGKPRLEMSEELFSELARAKRENYVKIYRSPTVEGECAECIEPAFELMYARLLSDVQAGDERSYIYRHHVKRVQRELSFYGKSYDWQADPDQTVVDYIASMTDGYFIELAEKLFPELAFPRRTYIRG